MVYVCPWCHHLTCSAFDRCVFHTSNNPVVFFGQSRFILVFSRPQFWTSAAIGFYRVAVNSKSYAVMFPGTVQPFVVLFRSRCRAPTFLAGDCVFFQSSSLVVVLASQHSSYFVVFCPHRVFDPASTGVAISAGNTNYIRRLCIEYDKSSMVGRGFLVCKFALFGCYFIFCATSAYAVRAPRAFDHSVGFFDTPGTSCAVA